MRDFFRDDHVHAALIVSPAGQLEAVVERGDIAKCQALDAAAGATRGPYSPGSAPAWPRGGVAAQPRWSRLSLAEWVVLCLVSEKPTHSFAIASLLAKDGSLGQVWHVQKAVAYRAAERLVQLGLITATEKQPSNLGPARSQLEATSKGEQAARDWLRQPVTHPRDIRSELLVKLALLGRVNSDPSDLLRRQRAQLVPIADALAAEVYGATGFDRTLALWRHESVSATLQFLDGLLATAPAAGAGR
jgi:DNA-binding PadR family transcriptional regulator